MKDNHQQDDSSHNGQRQIHLVHGPLRFGHPEFKSQGTGTENEADENGLGQSIVQTAKDGSQQADGRQPVCYAKYSSHLFTKLGKKYLLSKHIGLAEGFDRATVGFNFG
jgi:hypothetical protein